MIDTAHQISAVARTLGTRTLEAGEARVMTIGQTYPTDLDDLWEACTTGDRLARWFLPVDGDLRVGGRYQLEGNAGGTIERCDAPHSFAATWEYGEEVSWITVTLTPVDADHTRLELEHVAHVTDEWWVEFGPGATGIGWDSALLGLALHLDDAAVEHPDPSRADTVFLTASGGSWFAAAVASGLDEQGQRAAADRSIAFYTGAPA